MTPVKDSLFARVLRTLATLVCRHPKWFVIPQIILGVVSVFYTVHQLEFDMSRDNLVGAEKKYHQVYLKYRKEFPGQDELVVVAESENLQRNRQFVERLAAKLECETNVFTDVFYKGDLKALGSKALLFLPEKDLHELGQTLSDYGPLIKQFTAANDLNSLFALINRQFRTAKREQNAENDSLIKAIPALQRIVEQATESLSRPGTPPSPGIDALFGAGEEAEKKIYISFNNGRIYLVTARARSADLTEAAIIRMRQLMAETQAEVPGLNIGLTGEPVLEYDEMRQSERDSMVATAASLILCALIFIYAYRETGRPLKTVLCLILGLAYTMGFTTLVIGHLNILTVTFAPILIGLAIDFGIHLSTRFEEEIRAGKTVEGAIEKALVYTGQGIVTGAMTTAGAFLAMGFTDFKGIQEMGIISGGGLILCLIPMLTLLPVLLMRGKQNVIDHEQGDALSKRVRIENLWLQRPWTVVAVTSALCVMCVLQFKKVYFDYNLLNMQSEGLPAVVFEKKLVAADKSVLFAAVVNDSPEETQKLAEKVKQLPSVAEVQSMADYFVEDQARKLELVGGIKKSLAEVRFAESEGSGVQMEELSSTLWYLMGYLGLASPEAAKEDPELGRQLNVLRTAISELRVKMLSGAPGISERLFQYQSALFDDIRTTFEAIKNQDTTSGLRPEDLPPSLHNRFIGKTGKHLLLVFPKKDAWQHDVQREFISDLRSVVPEDKLTGTPIQLYEYTTLLKESYQQAAYYALAAIAIMVLLHFRSVACVILALLPVAIGTVWMLGLMGRADIPFNPANIMTLPLVIGIGVTNGVHILNRFAEELEPSILAKSTGKAVLVSGLTSIVGFGSLMFGQHQGIQSLGYVMSVGIATCMIAGLTSLPALLTLLARWGWSLHKKKTQ